MTFDPGRPFNDLPDLPPASEIETKAILRSCIAARVALAELRVSGGLIPNQAMLINSIPLLEAQASSEIENIVTTTDRLFRYANDAAGRADPATREALRHCTALHRGFEMLERRPVSIAMAVEVCRTIEDVELDIRTTPGTALVDDATGEVIYTPPEGEDVLRRKLTNWERYIHETEAIHPFVDGNGRTGRVLNLLYLVDKGLLDIAGRVAGRAGVGKLAAGDAVDTVFEAIAEALGRGEDVRIAGFGTFGTRSRPARTGRNPRTGESLEISASTAPTFKAGKPLRDAVNAGSAS